MLRKKDYLLFLFYNNGKCMDKKCTVRKELIIRCDGFAENNYGHVTGRFVFLIEILLGNFCYIMFSLRHLMLSIFFLFMHLHWCAGKFLIFLVKLNEYLQLLFTLHFKTMHVLEYLNKYLMHKTYKNDYRTIRAYKSIQGMRK